MATTLVAGEAVEANAVRRRLVHRRLELLRLHVHAVLRLRLGMRLRALVVELLLVGHCAGVHGLLAMVKRRWMLLLIMLLLLLLLYLLLLLEVIARSRVSVHLLVMVIVVMLLLVSLARKGLSRRQRPPERHRTVSICRWSCWWENEALRSQVSCHAFRLVDFIGFSRFRRSRIRALPFGARVLFGRRADRRGRAFLLRFLQWS